MTPPPPFGLLLVSQGDLAGEIVNAAAAILGDRPDGVLAAGTRNGDKRADIESEVRGAVRKLAKQRGQVLILCDLFGSTPANVARAVAAESPQVACCCGLNLAMLLEALSFRHLPLDQAVPKVVAAGRRAVVSGGDPDDSPND